MLSRTGSELLLFLEHYEDGPRFVSFSRISTTDPDYEAKEEFLQQQLKVEEHKALETDIYKEVLTKENFYFSIDEDKKEKNLKIFKAWVGEEAWMLKRWNARGDVPGATKEEISRMKLKY